MRPSLPEVDSYRKNAHARRLFNGIAGSYSAPARAFSFFQYDRWHRFLVSRLNPSRGASVLGVCTGTGLVASRMAEKFGCEVVGIDLSQPTGTSRSATSTTPAGSSPSSTSPCETPRTDAWTPPAGLS